jgi:hypothetical protein
MVLKIHREGVHRPWHRAGFFNREGAKERGLQGAKGIAAVFSEVP